MLYCLRWSYRLPELTIVVPTYNERKNLVPLTTNLASALAGIDYQVIFVDDDSMDSTAAAARSLAQHDGRIHVLQRIGRRGLASAAVEGMLAASSPFLLVMDADLQHDERVIPAMLEKIKTERLDVVVATRNAEGGSMGEFAKERVGLSKAGRFLSSTVCRVPISDPMSGFFVVRSEYFHRVVHNLSCVGFKILVDLLASSREPVKVGEVGFRFRNRVHGESKLDILVGLEYLQLLLHKLTRGMIPVSYLLFGLMGAVGVVCNFLLAGLFSYSFDLSFKSAQFAGALITIAINFLLNNELTFRSARLRGRRFLEGLAIFYACCSIGLFAQVMVANGLRAGGMNWPTATLAGIAIGSVWNYSTAFLFVWQVRRRRTQLLAEAYADAGANLMGARSAPEIPPGY
jgi:dolichol-phosphate mannosyltransferase